MDILFAQTAPGSGNSFLQWLPFILMFLIILEFLKFICTGEHNCIFKQKNVWISSKPFHSSKHSCLTIVT